METRNVKTVKNLVNAIANDPFEIETLSHLLIFTLAPLARWYKNNFMNVSFHLKH